MWCSRGSNNVLRGGTSYLIEVTSVAGGAGRCTWRSTSPQRVVRGGAARGSAVAVVTGRSVLQLKRGADPLRNTLAGSAARRRDNAREFGVPLTDTGQATAVCIYDASSMLVRARRAPPVRSAAPAHRMLAAAEERTRVQGSRVAARRHENADAQGGRRGTAKIVAKGAGATLVPPLPAALPVVVQLITSDGSVGKRRIRRAVSAATTGRS